jgi:uncharacterized membrane protein
MRKKLSWLFTLFFLSPVLGADLVGTIRVDVSGLAVISVEGFEEETNYYTSKTGCDWYFSFNPPNPFEEINLKLYLPANSLLKSIDSNLDYVIGYDNSLVLTFQGLNETPRISVNYAFKRVQESNYFLLLIPLLCGVLIVVIVWFSVKKRKVEDKVLRVLSKRERQVMLTLKNLGGNVKQSKLRQVTGLPKSTLSRTINSLQKKGLIEKQGHGMTNRVLLK